MMMMVVMMIKMTMIILVLLLSVVKLTRTITIADCGVIKPEYVPLQGLQYCWFRIPVA